MLLAGAALLLVVPPAFAQSEPPIWSGVYSAAQAERGKEVVTRHCVRCHGENRPLSGDMFMLHWEGHTVARLLRKIKETMPVQQIKTVSDADKLDAMAFILQENGFPPAETDAKDDPAALAPLKILLREGPRPMRSGMVAEIVGCLAKGAGTTWQLTNSTEPAATALDQFESDLKAAAEAPPGTLTFQLMFPPEPEPHVGKKVLVKGLLLRRPAGDRLNVISIEPVALACSQ
jgi:mono/diheme cytochrome c family protein